MTTNEFTKVLKATLTERMTNRLIELAEESIEQGVEEYIEKGYIILDFKGEFDSLTASESADKMRKELFERGLTYYDYRCVSDTAWAQMSIHLRKEGWEFALTDIDGKSERIVKMPSKLKSE